MGVALGLTVALGSIFIGGLLAHLWRTEDRIAALEKRVTGSGPAPSPRSPGLPQSAGPGDGQPYGGGVMQQEAAQREAEYWRRHYQFPSPQRW
jgi:hypothetical protein